MWGEVGRCGEMPRSPHLLNTTCAKVEIAEDCGLELGLLNRVRRRQPQLVHHQRAAEREEFTSATARLISGLGVLLVNHLDAEVVTR